MSLQQTLANGRAAAVARMRDTFDICYETDQVDTDETGHETPVLEVDFRTPGRLKVSGGLAVNESELGGRAAATVTRELHIPFDSKVVRPRAIAVCVAVDPETSDPTLLGVRLRIPAPAPGSQQTARRLQVEEYSS